MIVMIHLSGYDINLPGKVVENCLDDVSIFCVTHLYFGTTGGKIGISIDLGYFLVFIGLLPG